MAVLIKSRSPGTKSQQPFTAVGAHLLFIILALIFTNHVSSASDQDQTCDNDDPSCSVQLQWGVVQQVAGDKATETQAVIDKTIDYMLNTVFTDDQYQSVRDECKNRHELCAFWSTIGECDVNPKYMTLQCAPSCQTCDQISFEARCPYDKNEPTFLQNPGDLNSLFERLITFEDYQPKIFSMPNPPSKEEGEDDNIMVGPWVVTLENFLTSEECDTLIELGATEGYARSKDVGKQKFDGTFDSFENQGRTSENAWCHPGPGKCAEDPAVVTITEKMVNITGVPFANYEYFQMLRYEEGQFYQTHHDYIGFHKERAQGVRILTVFLYLNDVEEGGGTNFPRLQNLTVTPKKGRALVWPSVLDEKPNEWDPRTHHGALPVLKGIKYGTNAWIHQKDFRKPFEEGCQ
mmetsp:Transcript_4933/g.7482  ORF Transcript_4933/g.7482 Transcript_4933/m.7482 type:complete len:405 (+) Transcript_4933:61-1275(+)|eukprot:CAMPEP_0195282922 /NCGR_PEP_ID=MMETSP0707-20130614/1633_1 /TAXON_ID=33640 /ORGANISM="Asterionellopsis glacialis, Strain CCMP134" /LENGTH=404 /DNA_ID=CAMNT_0040341995 /DNA_START=56 /DNA_END=1270 /DNA_ORIENTATION=+